MRHPACSGRAWQQLTHRLKQTLPPLCRRCGQPINLALPPNHPQAWTAGHIVDLARGGHPTDPNNLAPEHRSCNSSAGARLGNRRRKQGPLAW